MNLDKAEQFLKDKGLDTEKYRIKDVNGGYLPQIPIALWLTEFAEKVKNNDLLHDVSHCSNCKQPLKAEKVSPVGYNICTCNWDTSNCG